MLFMERNVYGYIYMIRNTVNGKIYFGQTKNSFKKRYGSNFEKHTHNQHLKNSIKKYGVENFEVREEFDVAYSKEELDELENLYIKIYNTIDSRFGYNKRYGGSHGKLIEESCKILSMKNSGGNSSLSIKVVCLNLGKIFDCVQEASKWANSDASSIIKCCRGKRKFAGRLNGEPLQWCYLNDHETRLKTYTRGWGMYICLNNLKTFCSLEECGNYASVTFPKISDATKNQRKCAGRHPITKEFLYWMRYDDFLREMKQKGIDNYDLCS